MHWPISGFAPFSRPASATSSPATPSTTASCRRVIDAATFDALAAHLTQPEELEVDLDKMTCGSANARRSFTLDAVLAHETEERLGRYRPDAPTRRCDRRNLPRKDARARLGPGPHRNDAFDEGAPKGGDRPSKARGRTKMKHLMIGTIAAGAISASTAYAQETLTAVHAFPETLIYTKSFLEFVDKVNERRRGRGADRGPRRTRGDRHVPAARRGARRRGRHGLHARLVLCRRAAGEGRARRVEHHRRSRRARMAGSS